MWQLYDGNTGQDEPCSSGPSVSISIVQHDLHSLTPCCRWFTLPHTALSNHGTCVLSIFLMKWLACISNTCQVCWQVRPLICKNEYFYPLISFTRKAAWLRNKLEMGDMNIWVQTAALAAHTTVFINHFGYRCHTMHRWPSLGMKWQHTLAVYDFVVGVHASFQFYANFTAEALMRLLLVANGEEQF